MAELVKALNDVHELAREGRATSKTLTAIAERVEEVLDFDDEEDDEAE